MEVNRSWLITGGCGFIGTSLIAHLLKENPATKIRVFDNLSVGTKKDLAEVCTFVQIDPPKVSPRHSVLQANSSLSPESSSLSPGAVPVELVVGDIRNYEICLSYCEGIDIVVHLAANTGVAPSVENPRADMESNVIGTFNLLEASRIKGVDRFVFASSGAPIGECEPPIHEELAPHPVSPYGASKLAGEGYCSGYYRTFGIETIVLRFGNVYGPLSDHKNSVVAKFIKRAMAGNILEIYGDGSQTRDFIYINDLVNAIRLSATVDSIGGETFQIATNSETTILELIEELLPILYGFGFKNVQINNTAPRLGDVKRNFSNTSKAKNLLGWNAKVQLQQGLKRTVDWFIGMGIRSCKKH